MFPTMNTIAYADGGTGGGDGTGGGWGGSGGHSSINKALAMHWVTFDINNWNYVVDWDWVGFAQKNPNFMCTFLSDGRRSHTPGVQRFYGWDDLFSDWQLDQRCSNHFQWMYKHKQPDPRFIKQAHHDGYEDNCWIRRWSGSPGYKKVLTEFPWWEQPWDGGLILDRIWVYEKDNIKVEIKKGNKISYVNGGLGEQLDHRNWSAEKEYNEGRETPVEYYFKTKPNETVATRRLDAQTVEACRKAVYRQSCSTDSNGNTSCTWVLDHYEYWIANTYNYTKDFTYNTITPTIKKEPFKPWNLNRNGYATIDDISSQYAHAKLPIELDVNNNQGIYDNSPLKALDINNDTFFKFKFTNGYLGMPSVFNWTNPPGTPPGILSNGTWEDAGSGSYANGRNANADKDGLYRYNVKLHMSMSPNTKKPFVDTSSINFNGSEFTTSEEALQRPPWAGGNMSTRFTYADTYWTDNDYGSSSFPAWWVNTYTMGRFYEYGSEWRGIVGLDGIHDPNDVRYGTGKSLGGDRYKITIDANKQQKGLYVGYASANFEQPIITGTWEVKTVAGYVN